MIYFLIFICILQILVLLSLKRQRKYSENLLKNMYHFVQMETKFQNEMKESIDEMKESIEELQGVDLDEFE